MTHNPHEITYGYDLFVCDDVNYEPLNLDPSGRNFEYKFNNSPEYDVIEKEDLPISHDPVFINGKLNEAYINNKKNIENYFIKQQLKGMNGNVNVSGDDSIIPENGYGTRRKYYFPGNSNIFPKKEHMVDSTSKNNIVVDINIKNILIILIFIYIILNIIIHKYKYKSYKYLKIM